MSSSTSGIGRGSAWSIARGTTCISTVGFVAIERAARPQLRQSHHPSVGNHRRRAAQGAIERYAAVSAALANGEPRADVLRRNVLTHTMWLALAQAWAERFTREPTLAEQYRALVARARKS